MRIYRCCLGYLAWHILLQIGSYIIHRANCFFVNFVMQKVHFRRSSIVNFTVAWELVLQSSGILCKGSYSSSIFLGRSQVPIGILFVNRISLRTSRLLAPPHEQLLFTESQTIQHCRATELSLGFGFADGNISMQAHIWSLHAAVTITINKA